MKPLSTVIITYNRPDDVLLLLQNIAEQDDAARLQESLILNNNKPTEDYQPVQDYIYRITYDSSVAIIRNKSPIGRIFHAERMQMLRGNKSKVATAFRVLYSAAVLVITIF